MAFFLCVVFVFVRFTFLNEIVQTFVGDFPLLLVIGGLAVLAALATGAAQRAFAYLPTKLLLLYSGWMFLSIVTSDWISNSLNTWFDFVRTCLPLVFILGGVVLTTKDYFRMSSTIGICAIFNVASSLIFGLSDERFNAGTDGLVANSNDFAAHLLFVLPFLLWMALTVGSKFLRVILFGIFLGGIVVGAHTGSRGALLSILIVLVVLFFYANNTVRMVSLMIVPALFLILAYALPTALIDRYMTLFGASETAQTSEAVASSAARTMLLKESIELALTHPLLGVGPNQFVNVAGADRLARGIHGVWQPPHNSFLQVASEEGLPAFFFFLGTVIASYRMFSRCYSRCAGRPDLRKLRLAALSMMMTTMGFGVASCFVNMPYYFYVPALAGLAISLTRVTENELKSAALPA